MDKSWKIRGGTSQWSEAQEVDGIRSNGECVEFKFSI